MGIKDTLEFSHQLLEQAGIRHALIGGLGLATLGVHRATFDVDWLADGGQKDKVKFIMVGAGWKLAMETQEVFHFEGRGRVDFLFANRPLTLEMLATAQLNSHQIPYVSAEGIIGLKIQAYKNDSDREFQDKADIKALVKNQPKLDWSKIKIYADLFEEWPFIQSLRSK